MKEERGKWEKIIHSKLYDFEADVNPADWEIISGRLPGGRSVRLHPYRRYVAAAVIAVLLIAGGVWFYPGRDPGRDTVAVTEQDAPVQRLPEKDLPAVKESTDVMVEKTADNLLTASGRPSVKRDTLTAADPPARLRPLEAEAAPIKETKAEAENGKEKERETVKPEATPYEKPLIADASSVEVKKRRRWGFGMGGGSYSMTSSSENTPPLTLSSSMLRDENTLKEVVNSDSPELAVADSREELRPYAYKVPPGKVKHKAPLSAGLGVSYFLNDRWSLQSGVTYTFLRSEWNSDHLTDSHAEYKQYLHFIGIPLSLSYKIAEWKRLQVYVSAGGMSEFNVAGKYKETRFSENLEMTTSENLHMKRPMWSVNTRAGVSYPLWRFINVYGEAGASYYFDNKSGIETIRSDKPFNVSLQAGIRLGF
ncbi:MAG: outer membrane beta-barrel protein [Tannerella sp.]|jgi:opacity protein-like surface antigen|nr:outer membrane beta-barrel protein [Tannerella sp.]